MLLIHPYVYLFRIVGLASFARRPPSRPDKTNERTRRIRTGSGCGRISGIRSFLEHECQLLSPKVIRFEASSRSLWRALGSQFGSRGALLEASSKYPGSILGILMNCCAVISMDEPEVRRVGFASFVILPPSRAIAPLLLWRRGSSGSGGWALCNARDAEIRTYGSSVCF